MEGRAGGVVAATIGVLEAGALRAELGPDGADGVFGRAVAAQARVEGESIRAGLVEAFGVEALRVEVVLEWGEVVIRCLGLVGDDVVEALESAEAGIRQRIDRVGAAAVEAARVGDGFWTLEAEAFEVDVMHASETVPAPSSIERGLPQVRNGY